MKAARDVHVQPNSSAQLLLEAEQIEQEQQHVMQTVASDEI